MLKVEALRAELDQTRLRGAPLHHGYGASVSAPPRACRPRGAPGLVAGERAEYGVTPGVSVWCRGEWGLRRWQMQNKVEVGKMGVTSLSLGVFTRGTPQSMVAMG